MLETISRGFKAAKDKLHGETKLTYENVAVALREVRLSLLEADVEFNVVKNFLNRVKEKAVGQSVNLSVKSGNQRQHLRPYEHFIGICFEELETLMGPESTGIELRKPISSIMMVGLQGAGKTTTTAKLALYLKQKGHNPMLVAADIYRPAAVEQLKILGQQIDVPVYFEAGTSPQSLCEAGLKKAKDEGHDVVIFDTAGRLAIDDKLMNELEQIKACTNPSNIFMVIDAMIGQDAVSTAREFNQRLELDGYVLTKLDGDARGGAALSIREVTNKPIKFLGMGEKLENFEEFRPSGLASRILGMGDVVGLVKDFEKHIDEEKAQKDAEKLLKGQLSLEDFLDQLRLMKKMGSIKDLMDKLPGMSQLPSMKLDTADKEITKFESIILSMTRQERIKPQLVTNQKSRRARIAKGSGRAPKEIDNLLNRFFMMQKMMGAVATQPGLLGRLPMFKGLGQMSKIAGAYGRDNENLMGQAGGMFGASPQEQQLFPGGFGAAGQQQSAVRPLSTKQMQAKKNKRKNQKLARKKSKRGR